MACTAPGLQLTFDPTVLHAATPAGLCIAWGVPRASGSADPAFAPAAPVDDLLQRLSVTAPGPALTALRGGYALLHLDGVTGRVVLAVDRFSIETLCYAFDGARLAFADRADAVPLARRTLALQSIYDYLDFHCLPAPGTMFGEVQRLVRGTHVVAERGKLRCESHWQPHFQDHADASLPALCESFRALTEAAVRQEAARGGVPGCFLSGGTDSSTVAGMLARVVPRVRTYSIGFDAAGYDEMSYARIAAQHFGTDHHEYYVTPADVTAAIPALAAFCDQPFGNSSLVPSYYCAKMAREDGVGHLLAGDGGDELFGGNSRYALQLFLALYDRLPAGLRRNVLEPAAGHPALRRIPGLRQAAGYVRHSRVPMPDRMETFNLLLRVGADNVLHPDVLAAIDETAPLAARRRLYAESAAVHPLDRILYYDWKLTLADSDLPKVRTATQAAGTTVGYPFLADEIADFSLRMPAQWKVRRFRLRWFFKYALRDFLPPAILRKKKHGFGLPFGAWALQHAPLRALASDSLASLEQRRILRPRFRDQLMGTLLPSHPGYYGELVWILMMLEQWLHAHQPGERVTPAHAQLEA
jgi:asparagine synthase (glutamine-hydrolysing)